MAPQWPFAMVRATSSVLRAGSLPLQGERRIRIVRTSDPLTEISPPNHSDGRVTTPSIVEVFYWTLQS